MTYCLAIRVNDGLVFGSDSRTNAGVDYVTTYRKMHVFQPAADRIFVLLSAGSLATTQAMINNLNRDLEHPTDGGTNLASVRYLFEAAEYIGALSQQIQQRHAAALAAAGFNGEVSLILGGQIQGEDPEIMLIYPQGNYISASNETPYLQIGESKYGKPNLDRLLDAELPLEVAARVALTSLDATARSNITVGPPFDLAMLPRDSLAINHHLSVTANAPYLANLREAWNQGLRNTLAALPAFDWETPPGH